jgi:hypothetical protein
MTKPLAQTNRDLLLDLHARLPSIEGGMQTLLAQNRELEQGRESDRATIHLLARTVERLHRENEALMQMVGRMTSERLQGGKRSIT